VLHAFADHTKARSILRYEPHVDLATGLGKMAAWVQEHGVRASRDFDAIEVHRNLPPAWRK
jgi:hypothetical protein